MPSCLESRNRPELSGDTGGVVEVRLVAAHALGRIGQPDPDVLVDLEKLFFDENKLVRIAAAVSHARLTGNRKGFEILLKIVRNETAEMYTRTAAINGLIETRLLRVEDRDVLLSLLEAKNETLGVWLLPAIVKADPENKMELLSKYLKTEDFRFREVALSLLVEEYKSSVKYLPDLVALLDNPEVDWRMKYTVIEAMSAFDIDAESALPSLRKAASSSDWPEIRKLAKSAIESIETAMASKRKGVQKP